LEPADGQPMLTLLLVPSIFVFAGVEP